MEVHFIHLKRDYYLLMRKKANTPERQPIERKTADLPGHGGSICYSVGSSLEECFNLGVSEKIRQ